MDIFTETDLNQIASIRNNHCISIFMPTFRTGTGLQQNPIRYKNLIGSAEEQLVSSGLKVTEASIILKSAKDLLKNDAFWHHPADGLVAFIAPGMMKIYRLPESFPQLAVVGNRFHLKPLISMLVGNTRFFILDLNVAGVRLFMGSRFMLTRIFSDKLPPGLDETLGFDTKEKDVQFSSKPAVVGENPSTVFGYGRQTDKRKVNILNYFHRVNDAIMEIFLNSNAPLVLAGVEYLHPIYRDANTYPYLIENGLPLDIQYLSEQQIHQKSWPLVEHLFNEIQSRDARYYKKLYGDHSPIAVNDLQTIVQGAHNGRINTLFITDGATRIWGKFIESEQKIDIHSSEIPGDEDLLDKAAIDTMLKGGTVYILEQQDMPDTTVAAAILRY